MTRSTHTLLALWLAAGVAHADTLVCRQGRVVQPGMTPDDVLQKCGPPTTKQSRTEDLRAVGKTGLSFKHGEVVIETWRYDRGTQKPAALVVIKEGKVIAIEFVQ